MFTARNWSKKSIEDFNTILGRKDGAGSQVPCFTSHRITRAFQSLLVEENALAIASAFNQKNPGFLLVPVEGNIEEYEQDMKEDFEKVSSDEKTE